MHSIFDTFKMTDTNNDALDLAQLVSDITDDLFDQYREEVFRLYHSDNARGAIREQVIKFINVTRKGLLYSHENIETLVLEKIFDYYPVQHLIDDEDVTDVYITKPDNVSFKKKGIIYSTESIVFPSIKALELFITKSVWKNGGDITQQKPYYLGCDKVSKLRIDASLPPLSGDYPNIHFRIHHLSYTRLFEMQEAYSMMDVNILKLLQYSVKANLKILVVGAPGSGKTTLSRAIINEIPSNISSASVEESLEWYIEKRNHRPFTLLQRINEVDKNSLYDMSTLSGVVRFLLLCGTNCISIGEIKGAEAFNILHAYRTGCFGVNTLHVDHIIETHKRFAFMAAANPSARNYPIEELEETFSQCFDLIIFMESFKVKDICELDYKGSSVVYNHLYEYVGGGTAGTEGYYKKVNPISKRLEEKICLKEMKPWIYN